MTTTRADVIGKLADIMGRSILNVSPMQFVSDAYAEVLKGHDSLLTDEEVGLVCDMSDQDLYDAVKIEALKF